MKLKTNYTVLRGLLALGAGLLASALPGSASSITADEDGLLFINGGAYRNGSGQIAYTWRNPDYDYNTSPPGTIESEAVLRDSTGGEIHLGTLGGSDYGSSNSYVYGISNDGWVFGDSNGRAFVWKPDAPNGTTSSTGMTPLGTLITDPEAPYVHDYSNIYTVNGNGMAVGQASTSDANHYSNYQSHAFVWTETDGMKQIVSGWDWSQAMVVNNSGQVAGTMSNYTGTEEGQSPTGASHNLFRWTGEAQGFEDLGELAVETYGQNGWVSTNVTGITEDGLIVGTINVTDYTPGEEGTEGSYVYTYSAFVWKNAVDGIQPFLSEFGNVEILGTSGDRIYGVLTDEERNPARAEFLNTHSNEDLDLSSVANYYGFIWTEEGGLQYVDELFADQLLTAEQLVDGTTAGWVAVYAVAGNSDEQMDGLGLWWDGENVGLRFVLMSATSAVPEPATYAALAGLAMLVYVLLRRRR